MKIIYTLIATAVLVTSCKSTEENLTSESKSDKKESVIKPIANVDNEQETFRVEANKADTILLSNGGSIVFEENSFVDSKGKLIKGKVDVHWEEFHSLEDIMLSGIPMKYDSAGVAYDLSSGGMFTMSASQKDKKVELADGKSAQVNLASLQDTPCYNFYELDTTSGQWKYETTKSGEVASAEKDVEDNDESEGVDILHIDLMTDHVEELADKEILGWKTKDKITKKDRNLLSKTYSKSKLEKADTEGDYLATIVVGKERLSYTVQPYFMSDAVKDSKANNAELTSETSALLKYAADVASGKVIRSIEIDNFGTYNWDIVNYRENSQRVIAKFKFPKKTDSRLIALYLISPDENIIVKYDAGGDKQFSFDPDKRNCIVAIMPDNKLVSFSDKDFDIVRKKKRGTSYEFALKDTGIKLKSSKDISNHLEELI